MPIEFACESCSQLLRVPDGSGGQSCQCPACQEVVLIPDPQSIAAVEMESGGKLQAGNLTIACPKCRYKLICPTSLLGTKGQCRNCQTIFTIEETRSDGHVASQAASPSFIFNCPKCNQLFEGQAEMEGRKGKCHACGAVFAISLKSAEVESRPKSSLTVQPIGRRESSQPTVAKQQTSPVQTTEQAQLNKLKPSSPRPRPVQSAAQTSRPAASSATIQFACTKCQGVMEVPSTTAGRNTECPYCRQLLTIPHQSTIDDSSPLAATNYYVPPTEAQPQMFPEPQNVVTSATADGNPYASSLVDPHIPYEPSQEWTKTTRKKIRGLTFANAFELTLNSLLPYCLVASAAFLLIGGMIFVLVLSALRWPSYAVQSLQLEPESTAGMTVVVFGLLQGLP